MDRSPPIIQVTRRATVCEALEEGEGEEGKLTPQTIKFHVDHVEPEFYMESETSQNTTLTESTEDLSPRASFDEMMFLSPSYNYEWHKRRSQSGANFRMQLES